MSLDLSTYMSAHTETINRHLESLVPLRSVAYKHLFEAARYSLLGPGKRIRPLLTFATVEALGGDPQLALSPACALEFIHTYSLIHDDLPCMDNDDYRRGRPTLHRVYPEGHAVLTGDYLLTQAFEVLCESPGLSEGQKLQLVRILAKRSGGEGMIAGQVMDISAEGKQIDLAALEQIHLTKTAALITGAIEFGAVVSGASSEQMEILQRFGMQIGLAFQIVDDILDVTSSDQQHGKLRSSDLENGKTTYVTLLGLEGAREKAKRLHDSAHKELTALGIGCDSALHALADLMIIRKK